MPIGDLKADIVIVTDFPRDSEDATGLAIAGTAANLLETILINGRISSSNVLIVSAVACIAYATKAKESFRQPSTEEVKNCSTHLKALLDFSPRKQVYGMGSVAVKALKMIKQDHHSIPNPYYLFTQTPAKSDVHIKRTAMLLKEQNG